MGNLLSQFTFLAPFALFFQNIRSFAMNIFRTFWKKRTIPVDFSNDFYFELLKHCRVIRFDDYGICRGEAYSQKEDFNKILLFKLITRELLIYKNVIPIFVARAGSGDLEIQYLKFTFAFEKFLGKTAKITQEHHKNRVQTDKINRFGIYYRRGHSLKSRLREEKESAPSAPTGNGNGGSALVQNATRPPITDPRYAIDRQLEGYLIGDSVNDLRNNRPRVLKDKYQFTETGKKVLEQVQKWLEAKQWYQERNILWRRGILLHGKPGNGKSSLIQEIAKKEGIPVYVFDLSSMDNQEFENEIDNLTWEPAIVLFEDIDVVFDGRVNLTATQIGGLTFDCFINKLSGVNSIKNKFVFMTTNNLDKLDSALTRPGRIDDIIELPQLGIESKLSLAKVILEDPLIIEKVMVDGINDTTAEFENRCVRIALNILWNENHGR
jgi:hypothetical protein